MCLCPYAYEFNRWNYPTIRNNFLYPHCAIYLLECNQNPIKKVLVSGKISKIYPERQYIFELTKEYPDNFDILPVISKNSNDLRQGFEYYKHLNNYNIGIHKVICSFFKIVKKTRFTIYLYTNNQL